MGALHKPFFASLKELSRPTVIKALSYSFGRSKTTETMGEMTDAVMREYAAKCNIALF